MVLRTVMAIVDLDTTRAYLNSRAAVAPLTMVHIILIVALMLSICLCCGEPASTESKSERRSQQNSFCDHRPNPFGVHC